MWIAKDKDGEVHLFYDKPHRDNVFGSNSWTIDVPEEIKEYTKGRKHNDAIIGYCMKVNSEDYPNLKWEHEPIEVVITEKPNLSLSVIREETPDNTIVLTRYYEGYEEEHEWFVNMLKHQERYKDCTDEEIEEIWEKQIKEEYTFDEIWDTIQCDGYTKIALRMGRHDPQPVYDYVLETKEYIDEKMKNYW